MFIGDSNENTGRVSQATVASSVPSNEVVTDATTSSNANVVTTATSATPLTTIITTDIFTTASNVVNISDGSTTHHTSTTMVTGATPKKNAEDNNATSLIPANNNSATTTLAYDTNIVHGTITEGATDIFSSEGAPIDPTSTISTTNTTTGANFSSTVAVENTISNAKVVSSEAAFTTAIGNDLKPTPTDGSTDESITVGKIRNIRLLAAKNNILQYLPS